METLNIMRKINRLPIAQRVMIAEKIMFSVRKNAQERMKKAVDIIYEDYHTDKELTIFTQLDCEDFYETR
jgi:hypothetical protein